MRLAREIVSIYHGESTVDAAEAAFRQVFQDHGTPTDLPEHAVAPASSATDVLLQLGWAESRSEARRLVDQKAVWLGEQLVTSSDAPLELREPSRAEGR